MTNKKVSIIIPCYNKAAYVKESILSALQQTYSNLEIICINDGSEDNSAEVIRSIVNQFPQKILFIDNKQNKGVVLSRNEAIQKASGEYILPLDADDIIAPNYVEKAANVLANNPHIGIVYCKANLFGAKSGPWDLPPFDKDNILFRNCIFCTALFRKSDFLALDQYKTYMNKGYEDWDLWLSFVEKGYGVHRIDEYLFKYRIIDSTSRNTQCLQQENQVLQELVKNHLNLYLSSDNFIKKIFKAEEVNFDKYKKYKRRCIIIALIALLEFIIVCISIYHNF